MIGLNGKGWSTNSSSNLSLSQTIQKEDSWKSFNTSMSAISFGFVATAILISMFIIMAIFEHFNELCSSIHPDDSSGMQMQMQKLGNPEMVQPSHAPDFTVVMPGQQHPTFIAHPAPIPCQREGIYWPSHQHSFT